MTEPESLQQVDRTYVRYQGRKLSYFSGCDYFRLASHPAVVRAAREGLKAFGLNVAASRLTTGNHKIYQTLESELADFFNSEDALLLPTGYLTTLAAAQALAGQFSHALVDGYAHPALLDAAHVLDCPVLKFKHRSVEDFSRTITRCGRGARPIVLTDGMFSHDGSIAPLKMYLDFLPADGLLLVDDAHGAGVLGKTGQGSLEAEGVSRRRIVQCITLSKAFGVFGGAVLGTRRLRKKILARSRLFMGCTPLPPPLAGAALAAVRILKNTLPIVEADVRRLTLPIPDDALPGMSEPRHLGSCQENVFSPKSDKYLRRRLFQNTNHVKEALRKTGLVLPENPGPIVPLHLSSKREAGILTHRLLAVRIYPPFLKYPGGLPEGYFRFVISSEHSRAQLDNLIRVLIRPL